MGKGRKRSHVLAKVQILRNRIYILKCIPNIVLFAVFELRNASSYNMQNVICTEVKIVVILPSGKPEQYKEALKQN